MGCSFLVWVKAFSMFVRSASRFLIDGVPDKTPLVSFVAQTCTIPLCMNESTYRIFIISSTKVSIYIMTVMQMAQMNCSILSLLPLKLSGLTALVLHNE